MNAAHDKRCLIDPIRVEMRRLSDRHYRIELQFLDIVSLRDLQRLLRDIETEKQMTVQQAWLQSWRR